jgi:GDP-4-dehydro-6-deoxy-D-mannose reductase
VNFLFLILTGEENLAINKDDATRKSNQELRKPPIIMITGANGFTGQHACKYFINVGYHVIAITRTNKHIATKSLITYEHCDLTNKKSVFSLIQKSKPDFLLHLAGQNHVGKSWNDPVTSLEANVMSTAYLLEALRLVNPTCKIVIVGSTLQFDPNNLSSLLHPYSLSKTLQVLIAQSWESLYGMDIMIAKPSNLIGPGVSNGVCSILAKKVIDMELHDAEKILEVNNLYVKRDFIDVRDAIAAYEMLFNYGISGEVYVVTSGKSRYLKEITDSLRLLSSIEFAIKTLHSSVEKTVEIKPSLLQSIGWKPIIPFEDSMEDILDYYREIN